MYYPHVSVPRNKLLKCATQPRKHFPKDCNDINKSVVLTFGMFQVGTLGDHGKVLVTNFWLIFKLGGMASEVVNRSRFGSKYSQIGF